MSDLILYSMKFDGSVLQRGFWLYIWRVTSPGRDAVYVGRTGDSSSPNAASPFQRIGQHLDIRAKAKGNALGRRLAEAGIDPTKCQFAMKAVGPLFPEEPDMEGHKAPRDQTAALEKALAQWIADRGYEVLGIHHSKTEPDVARLEQIIELLGAEFPPQ